jgi:diguanylate cyclase (GGDEF)-like protein
MAYAPPLAEHLDAIIASAGDIVLRLDDAGRILFASESALLMLLGDPAMESQGQALASLCCTDDKAALECALAEAVRLRTPKLVVTRFRSGEKEHYFELRIAPFFAPVLAPLLVPTAGLDGALQLLVVGRDMACQRAIERHLRHLATHDALTDLPNRALLADRICTLIAQSRRSGQGFAVAAIGLDGFKRVNDGLGHPAGDAVLRMAAARLRKTLRESDTLARVAGDEFVALLPGNASDAQIRLVTGRMAAALQAPFEVAQQKIYLGATIGISLYPQHAEDEVRLVAQANTAMTHAKTNGNARCLTYSDQLAGLPVHDISLEAAMFQGVSDGEFLLCYQPIVDAASRRIEGFETLMRWNHPTLGMVPPARFIPLAETNGLINLLGAWALKAACMQLREFEKAAGRSLYVSVNISPRQFRSDKFLDVLDDAITYSGIRGEQLLLEITEGTLMTDPVHAEAVLAKMAGRNARIAIDDFGTGYSSLAYLKRFPISVLKIDRAFVKDLPDSAKDGAICSTILDLARHLDLSVVAEGVESEAQLDFLRERGCRLIQGYLTGKPMLADAALATLVDGSRPGAATAGKGRGKSR